jgi:tetraacyldisaccharide 4'-kinase
VDHVWYESPIAFCGRRVVAVSGLADPEGFAATLEALGAVPVRHLAFPDHHPYSPSDWTAITQAARDVDFVVTTEKDLVKLERFLPRLAKLRAIRLELSMPADDEERLLKIAADCIDRHRQAPVSSSLASAGRDDNLSTRRSLVNGC